MVLLWYFILLISHPCPSLGQAPAPNSSASTNSTSQQYAAESPSNKPFSTSSPFLPPITPNDNKASQGEKLPTPLAQMQNRPNSPNFISTVDATPGSRNRERDRQQQFPLGSTGERDRIRERNFGQVDNVNRFNSISQGRPQNSFPSFTTTTGRTSFSSNNDINNSVNFGPGSSQDGISSFGGRGNNNQRPPVSLNPNSPFGNIGPSSGITPPTSGILKEP